MATATPVIKPRMLEIIRDAASEAVDKALVTIDGTVYEFPIFRTMVEGYTIRKYVYVQTQVGLVTNAVLLDRYRNELAVKSLSIQKGSDGFMIAFEMEIKLEVK